MKNDNLNKLNNLNNSKEIDEVIDGDAEDDGGDEDDEVKDEEINNNEVKKITHEERMALGKQIQKLIDTCRGYNHSNYVEFDECPIRLSRKLFQSKLFELSYVVIKQYLNANYEYFNKRNLEKLNKILNRALRIDYRKENEAMRRAKSLVKFSRIN